MSREKEGHQQPSLAVIFILLSVKSSHLAFKLVKLSRKLVLFCFFILSQRDSILLRLKHSGIEIT
jgi:hypothetical protein